MLILQQYFRIYVILKKFNHINNFDKFKCVI